jgi:hypothetical protein
MPFFSVIMPSFNRAELIRPSIDSVLAQDFKDFELIVVDDGSTDNTVAVLRSYGDRIKVFQQENGGPGAARNRGLQEAQGEYVAFLDSDDLWFPWTLATYSIAIEQGGQPCVVSSLPREFRQLSDLAVPSRETLRLLRYADFLSSPRRWFPPSGMAIRTQTLRAVGGMAHGACEDIDLCLRLSTSPGYVDIVQPLCFAYRQHAGGISKTWKYRSEGTIDLVDAESHGLFPGGALRRRERRDYLLTHVRPVALMSLRNGCGRLGWSLYRKTLPWHVSLGRVRFLLGFPMVAVMSGIAHLFPGRPRIRGG